MNLLSFSFFRKILPAVILVAFYFLNTTNSFAASEFGANYDVLVSIDESGEASVTENIVLVNKTDKFYPSNFTLNIGAADLRDLTATDSQGNLPVEVLNQGKKSEIKVDFINQQIVGLGKEYRWTLKFKTKDFATKLGSNWNITVPRLSSLEDIEKYNLTLSVPVSFSDPSTITPQPLSQSEIGGKINFNYTKNELSKSGLTANFGSEQIFDFNIFYNLKNDNFLPKIFKVALPINTNMQKVLISDIFPRPITTKVDEDNNIIAYYLLERNQKIEIKVSGISKVFINPQYTDNQISEEDLSKYLLQQKYWEKDSPQVKTKLKEIFTDEESLSAKEEVVRINQFLSQNLQFDFQRNLEESPERLGGLTILANPTKATSLEFSDGFMTLSRAAGVPSREIVGYAATSNNEIRPSSIGNKNIHVWVEYFDKNSGWNFSDPTWQATTGGIDYVNQFDLSHFAFFRRGLNSEMPLFPDFVEVNFKENDFLENKKFDLEIAAPQEIFAGFRSKLKIKVINSGNTFSSPSNFYMTSHKTNLGYVDRIYPELNKKINVSKNMQNSYDKNIKVESMPPFGVLEYEVGLLTGPVWEAYEDTLQFQIGEEVVTRKVLVKPFFAHRYFGIGVISVVGFMLLIYNLALVVHIKTANSKHSKDKSKS